jgi:feruloyl esterase
MLGGGSTVTNVNGNVTVPDNASCTLNFVNVKGNVVVGRGSTLLVTAYTEPSTIGGNVQANQCKSALLEGNVTVGGNVQIQLCVGAGPNGFQGPDVVINGNFQCQGNSSNASPCLAWLGRVKGNVQIQSNVAPTASDVSLVTVGGNLQCQHNSLPLTHLHGPSWVDGNAQDQCASFATTATQIDPPVTPAASCTALANLPAAGFPVPNTVIISATLSSDSLPQRCIINGYVNRHVSPVDNCYYQDGFQVQLPLPANWTGRFMFQGGGGTEGSVPTAAGSIGGSTGTLEIENGVAVASQDGGHENTASANYPLQYTLSAPTCGIPGLTLGDANPNEFWLDPLGVIGQAYQSIEVTTFTAKYLINQYYGTDPNRSYWVGCSTGGRQAMVMSENFPSFFDGIVAGDPVYDQEALALTEGWGNFQILSLFPSYNPASDNPADTAALAAYDASLTPPLTLGSMPTTETQTAPEAPAPHLYPAFSTGDQSLFETALMQACDALDGVTDGVIDNVPACQVTFNPVTATYVDYAGALGPANTKYSLQCPLGVKNATCLTPEQIKAAMAIRQGPLTSKGALVSAPAGAVVEDHVANVSQGYIYDGGFMTTVGVPARKIGSSAPTAVPGDFSGNTLSYFGYAFLSPADPSYNALPFFESPAFDSNLAMLTSNTANVTYSTSLDITHFVKYGHKIIWYHGFSDPGPPILGTILYYNQMAQQFGGLQTAQKFSRLYPVPNMDHCAGGATTDGFDMFTPLKNWVENGTAPGPITASSSTTAFSATTYQVVGNYITGTFVNAPVQRSRPLCPYPQQARFTGATSVVNGVPVATTPSSLASAANYTCMNGPPIRPPGEINH